MRLVFFAVTSPRIRLDYIEHIPDGDPTTGARERRTCYTSDSYPREDRDFAKRVALLRNFEQIFRNDRKVFLIALACVHSCLFSCGISAILRS